MFRLISSVFVVYFLSSFSYSSGYKWITLRSKDSIRSNAIIVGDYPLRFVGRATHYNLVVPAEVYNSTYARIFYKNKEYVKKQFEVLTDTEECEWKPLKLIRDIPENVVRGGTAWNSEPIFIGRSMGRQASHIASIYITSNRFESLENFSDRFVLTCKDMNIWIDASSGNVPIDAIPVKNHWDNNEYVGRLLAPNSWVPATVDAFKKNTRAHYQDYSLESFYCQILVGQERDYEWSWTTNETIPDYAVVAGQSDNGEMRYVIKEHDRAPIGYKTFSGPLYRNYSVLVKKT